MENNNRGFTLIEILASIVIIGLVITVLFNINIAGFKFMAYNQDRVELQNQARLITTNLEKQIRKATDIQLDTNNDEIILSGGDVTFSINKENGKPWQLKMEINGNVRNITDSVINNYTFELVNADKGLLYFYFELVKDNSTYEIQNSFYPRAKN